MLLGKIAQGITFERILDDDCDNLKSEDSLERFHLLNRQDLWNISRQFSLQNSGQLHKNDYISVD